MNLSLVFLQLILTVFCFLQFFTSFSSIFFNSQAGFLSIYSGCELRARGRWRASRRVKLRIRPVTDLEMRPHLRDEEWFVLPFWSWDVVGSGLNIWSAEWLWGGLLSESHNRRVSNGDTPVWYHARSHIVMDWPPFRGKDQQVTMWPFQLCPKETNCKNQIS